LKFPVLTVEFVKEAVLVVVKQRHFAPHFAPKSILSRVKSYLSCKSFGKHSHFGTILAHILLI